MRTGKNNARIQKGTGALAPEPVKTEKADPIGIITAAKAVLAPMAGVTDLPFRKIARSFGCKFAFTEMVDVNGLVYKNRKSFALIERFPGDSPLGVQIAGESAEKMLYAAKVCEEKGYDIIDINAGCPARKVIKGGKGAALLKDPLKLAAIVGAIAKNVSVPVTVKIRSGWDEASLNYLEVAKAAQGEGARAICVHPRSKEKMYKGKADQMIVREMKLKLKIPVFASGGIFSPQDVMDTLKSTGCDAVFVARGALGRPWIFRDAEKLLAGEILPGPPSFDEIKKIMIEHFSLAEEYHGAFTAVKRMYKHVTWYLKRCKNLNEIMRGYTKGVKNLEDFKNFIRLPGGRCYE